MDSQFQTASQPDPSTDAYNGILRGRLGMSMAVMSSAMVILLSVLVGTVSNPAYADRCNFPSCWK
ncbi:hypothetical protein CCACVL1_13002 [Corchorus capsularis]|uniref:Uncharacterized protein n=1 Tax=Corchorus capsularis TaxID=210143 RepID=A0A1R3ICQ6_COCAP|nr:hypothetical protein CCACVL1_13002 [Corchorus capsularis]